MEKLNEALSKLDIDETHFQKYKSMHKDDAYFFMLDNIKDFYKIFTKFIFFDIIQLQ